MKTAGRPQEIIESIVRHNKEAEERGNPEDIGTISSIFLDWLWEDFCTLKEALEEREGDMHARIRATYDKGVADSWRKEVNRLNEVNLQLMEQNPLYGICLRLGRAYVRLKAQGHTDSMGEISMKELKNLLPPEAFGKGGVFRDWEEEHSE